MHVEAPDYCAVEYMGTAPGAAGKVSWLQVSRQQVAACPRELLSLRS